MAKTKTRNKIPKDYAQQRRNFLIEELLVKKHYPSFACKVKGNRLQCCGIILPIEGCDQYHFKIDYTQGHIPNVFITQPIIEPRTEYHMYSSGNLCLYDYRETPWTDRMKIHETIIPWIAEWCVFYEIWKITGEWLGLSAPHGSSLKTQQEKII